MPDIEILYKAVTEQLDRLIMAARDAEDERRIHTLWASAASMRRALAIAALYEELEIQEDVAALLGIGQPAVCELLKRARRVADLEDFDVVKVAEGHPGYQPDQAGRLAVQQDGEWATWVVDLEEAAAYISSKVGTVVKLVDVVHSYASRRWEPVPKT